MAKVQALTFVLNEKIINFRIGKITPIKLGFFVTLWKRVEGITQPHHVKDKFDFFVISVRDDLGVGQFIFPKSALQRNNVVSSEKKEGKRGIRVYPPWIKTVTKQAQKTQQWQTKYFVNLDELQSPQLDSLVEAFNEK